MTDRKLNIQNIPIRTELGRQIREAFAPKPIELLVEYEKLEKNIMEKVSVSK